MTTRPHTPVPAEPTDAELKATIYFAVGVSSESGTKAYQLLVAGDNPRTPLVEVAGNSGYTIGTIQTDMGWHYQPTTPHGENVPRDLVNAYQHWARQKGGDWPLTPEQAQQTERDLGRQGHAIERDHGRPLDAAIKSKLDTFLASDAGISWVHERDVAQIEKLAENVLTPLKATALYRDSTVDDRIRLGAMATKLYNQSEVEGNRLLHKLQSGELSTLGDVKASISAIKPKAGDYLETGRDDALRGAGLVVAMRNAHPESPLRAAWEHVRDNSLANPTQLGAQERYPDLRHEYPTVRNMFVHHDRAPPFIQALDQGNTFRFGAVDAAHPGRFRGAGFFAAGNDFVNWSDDGAGHARIGGRWASVERHQLSRRTNPDHTLDLRIDEPTGSRTLLHVDAHAPALRPAQHNQQHTAPAGGSPHASLDPMHQQADSAVRRLDASLGREYDQHSACMAASLACLARENRFDRIDHVVLSNATASLSKGENVFVVQGGLTDVTNRVAHMKTQDALARPVEQSLQQLAAAAPSQTLEAPQQSQEAPARQTAYRITV